MNRAEIRMVGGMVDFDEEKSNSLFEILENWEAYLKAEDIDIPRLLKESNQAAAALSEQRASDSYLTESFLKDKHPEQDISTPSRSPKRKKSRSPMGPSR